MGGVIVKTRENYKSRRVAAAQRRPLCVRTGLQSRPPRPFLLLFLGRTSGLTSSTAAVGIGSGILRRRYSGEPGPEVPR